MKWYSGDIAEAVAISKSKGAIFVVYIEGKDDDSKRITDMIENGILGQYLEQDHFVPLKLEQGSRPHQQFGEIYKEPSVPSLYFIASRSGGVPLDIITGQDNLDNISQRIEGILTKAGIKITTANASAAASTSLIQNEKTKQDESNIVCENGVCSVKQAENTETTSEQSPEEKVQKAKELMEQLRKQKEIEEKQKEKQQELERRKLGQSVQQLKKWQEDQELKQILEQRDKEKRENQLARQRVLDQIAQDKAERQARMQAAAQPEAQRSQAPSPRVNSNSTRLQFKLPDGSSNTKDFAILDSLQLVVDYIKSEMRLPFTNFKLSTTFPRREFTQNDYSQSLLDLQLVPNAVVLILPLQQSSISANPAGSFTAMLWTLFAPIFNIFGYIKGFIFGTSTDNANPTQGDSAQSQKPDNLRRRVVRDSTVVRREGNIHRLSDRSDTDDEGNTWNGNSTQQM